MHMDTYTFDGARYNCVWKVCFEIFPLSKGKKGGPIAENMEHISVQKNSKSGFQKSRKKTKQKIEVPEEQPTCIVFCLSFLLNMIGDHTAK